MFKISTYGDGFRVHFCNPDKELLKQMNLSRKKRSWENVLFDPDFMDAFGFRHWSDLGVELELTGIRLDSKSRLEVRKNKKRFPTIAGLTLMETSTLFPVYRTVKADLAKLLEQYTLSIVEFETGMLHSWILEQENFDLTELTFQLAQADKDFYLTGIHYDETRLLSKSSDTVVRGQQVII